MHKGIYQHYKGNYYEVIDVARHSETLEDMIIYRALYGNFGLWVRPLTMFLEQVEIDGLKIPRFRFISNQPKVNNLIFEAHATSIDNERGIASGHLDAPLSEQGRAQARELGSRYQNSDISLVCCSDLQRSYETAKIAFGAIDIPIIKDHRLREWNYGDFNGYPVAEIAAMKLSQIDKPFPSGESLLDAVTRMTNFIQLLPRGQILIIGHRATYYALEYIFNNIPLETLLTTNWQWQPGWTYSRMNKL